MKCPKCNMVEMLIKSVQNNTVEYICKKCGNTTKEEMKEGEK